MPVVPVCVLVCLSLSMIKHYDQKELVIGEGLFVFKKKKSYHQGKPRQELKAQS